jgi:hypothetical protein
MSQPILYLRRKFTQLVPHHVFRYRHLQIVLAIVNLKLEAYKVGQDGRRAGLCSDGGDFVIGSLGPYNGETVARAQVCM